MFRFSRTRDVVETLVVESKEHRREDVESRGSKACESRSKEPFSESSRRSCSRGDMVAVGNGLRLDDFHGSRKKDVVADWGEDGRDGVEVPVHIDCVRVFGDTDRMSPVYGECVDAVALLSRELKARRRGLSGDTPADASWRL